MIDCSSIDAIILAGGQGTRLRQAVSDVPKPLAPIDGKPFLDILLAQLARFKSVHKVVLAVGYRADLIRDRYERCRAYDFEIEFSVEMVPLGTGGALCKALAVTESEHVLVLNGDSYVDFDLQKLSEAHIRSGAAVTMVVVQVEDTARFGAVALDVSGVQVVALQEKSNISACGFINAGCYLIERRALERFTSEPSSFEKDILPEFIGTIFAYHVTGKFIDIGIPETYVRAAEYLR